MARISELNLKRGLLVALWLASFVPWVQHRVLSQAHIYDIRVLGGLHPSEILVLGWVGAWSVYPPFIIFGAAVLSTWRPYLTSALLVVCTTLFVIYLLIFLSLTVMVMEFNVLAPR